MYEEILTQKSKKVVLLGNEAIVRGAVEAGVQFVATYPGTPASEVGNIFSIISRNNSNLYFEFSTNEKLAMEAVVGASFSGLKCLAAMKNFGMNVALEPLIPFCYTGSLGPTVIIVADDPSCHSSAQSEENSRGFARLAHIPVLEPSDAQECKDFMKLGFELSEKFNLPIAIRLTTRVAHQRAIVETEELKGPSQPQALFIRDKNRFVTMPPRVLEMHEELLGKIDKIADFAEQSEINRILMPENSKFKIQNSKIQVKSQKLKKAIGIIASGAAYSHAMEALRELNLNVPVLKLGFFYPLPEKKIKDFIKTLKKALIVEELDPYLEEAITALAKDVNPKLQIIGKALLPESGELKPEHIEGALRKIFELKLESDSTLTPSKTVKHIPRFCTAPVCPYWRIFAAVKKALPIDAIFGGDIGCYMIAAFPPTNLYDYMSCMGSSIGIGHGINKATGGKQKVVAFMGDSTFFHSGIPALINAVYNQSNILVVISDNRTTAMTGHQPNPGMGQTGEGEAVTAIKIEDIVQALQVKNLKVIDPVDDFDGFVETLKDFYQKNGVSVIVARRICALLEKRQKA